MKRLLAAALFLLPVHAFAQTPEETVAYILLGYEDGYQYDNRMTGSRGVVSHADGTSTYTLDETGPDGKARYRFDVAKTDDCDYVLKLSDDSGRKPDVTKVDMASYQAFSFAPGHATHTFTGKCAVDNVADGCSNVYEDMVTRGDTARQTAAVAFLRKSVCKGKDF